MLALPLESTTAAPGIGQKSFSSTKKASLIRLQRHQRSFSSAKKQQRLMLNAAMNAHFQLSSSASFSGDTQLQKVFPRCSPLLSPRHVRKILVVTALVKWKKDNVLDKVIERQKKLQVVNRLRNILMKQPGRVMKLKELAAFRHSNREIVRKSNRPVNNKGEKKESPIDVIRKYPAVFKVFETAPCDWSFCFTANAEAQYKEELELKKQMEDMAVTRLRKLLMMSVDRRILVDKLTHLKMDFGLPECFPAIFVGKYPEYFRLVRTPLGTAMEVNKWDPELAVTFAERKKQNTPENYEEISVSGRVPRFQRLPLPKFHKLSRGDTIRLLKFQQHPDLSPYEDCSGLKPNSLATEKRVVAVVQEILHLSLEKKLIVDHLTHFRHDFKFSQQLRGVLIRHPELFYVSLKGERDTVFLREAYNSRGQLIEEPPLVTCRRKLENLAHIGHKQVDDITRAEGYDQVEDLQDDGQAGAYDDGSWSADEDFHSDTKYFLEELQRRREAYQANKPPVEPW